MGLNGRRAIVTAASQGLGAEIARTLAARGAQVAIGARTRENLDAVASDIVDADGPEPFVATLDLSMADSIDSFVTDSANALGGIDIVVNNTGGPKPGLFKDLSDDDYREAFDLVFMSNVRVTRAALPFLRTSDAAAVINVLSIAVKQPQPMLLLSNALRLGLVGLAKTLADEVAPDGVRVVNVAPGIVHTDRVDALDAVQAEAFGRSFDEVRAERIGSIPAGRLGTPSEFANVVAFMASDEASFVTGQTLTVDGGMSRSSL